MSHLSEDSDDIGSAVAAAINSSDKQTVEKERASLATQFAAMRDSADGEPSHEDVDTMSPVSIWLASSACFMATVFSRIPSLQGYGDHNPNPGSRRH